MVGWQVVYRPDRSQIGRHLHGSAPLHAGCMNGIFFYIGLGAGLAAACGLRPFLPLLLAGALGSAGALGVSFARGTVPLPAVQLVASGRRRGAGDRLRAAAAASGSRRWSIPAERSRRRRPARGVARGPGIRRGRPPVRGHARRARRQPLARAARRLPRGGARAACLCAGDARRAQASDRPRARARRSPSTSTPHRWCSPSLVALFHPLGYVAVVLLAWFLWRVRARRDEKYAGLRILRR